VNLFLVKYIFGMALPLLLFWYRTPDFAVSITLLFSGENVMPVVSIEESSETIV